jgi:hypothetical protein
LDSGNLAGDILAPHVLRAIGNSAADLVAAAEGRAVEVEGASVHVPGLGDVSARLGAAIIYDGALSAELMERWVLTMDFATGRMWAAAPAANR